jgi:DNA-binding response OmpR family regulator
VLDLMLPDGDGASLLRAVREQSLRCRIAVTTGTNDTRRLRAVTALRPDLLLTKPINLAELLQGLDGDHRPPSS